MTDQALVDLAFTMLEHSYVPYSRFPVGAALLCGRRTGFERLAVVGRGADYCWPCGACRQMLYEFAPELVVLVGRGDGQFVRTTLRELLPHGFGPASLD